MNLMKYDNKFVRITDTNNDVFEGHAVFNSKEYNEHEYGVDEDSLQILNIVFYESYIKKVEVINKLNNKEYGNLEELIVGTDFDFIEDALDYGEKEHNDRLILCFKDHLDEFTKEEINKIVGGKNE